MLMTPPTEAPELPPVAMSPERADYLTRAVTGIAAVLVDSMMADLLTAHSPDSSDSSSRSDRLMYRALRPFLPRLRAVFLAKLSTSDPAGLERIMGAAASTIETILAQAPGDPLPRWTFEWLPGQPAPRLVPVAGEAVDTGAIADVSTGASSDLSTPMAT